MCDMVMISTMKGGLTDANGTPDFCLDVLIATCLRVSLAVHLKPSSSTPV